MNHLYVSTACWHANNDIDEHYDLHQECRQTCKFCDQPCACWCHSDAGVAGLALEREARETRDARRPG